MAEAKSGVALALGALASILASACCLGSLILVSLGLGGAWLGQLNALDPYRPYFLGVAIVALSFAYLRIFRPRRSCGSDRNCAPPILNRASKWLFWLVAVLVLVAFVYPYLLPLFY